MNEIYKQLKIENAKLDSEIIEILIRNKIITFYDMKLFDFRFKKIDGITNEMLIKIINFKVEVNNIILSREYSVERLSKYFSNIIEKTNTSSKELLAELKKIYKKQYEVFTPRVYNTLYHSGISSIDEFQKMKIEDIEKLTNDRQIISTIVMLKKNIKAMLKTNLNKIYMNYNLDFQKFLKVCPIDYLLVDSPKLYSLKLMGYINAYDIYKASKTFDSNFNENDKKHYLMLIDEIYNKFNSIALISEPNDKYDIPIEMFKNLSFKCLDTTKYKSFIEIYHAFNEKINDLLLFNNNSDFQDFISMLELISSNEIEKLYKENKKQKDLNENAVLAKICKNLNYDVDYDKILYKYNKSQLNIFDINNLIDDLHIDLNQSKMIIALIMEKNITKIKDFIGITDDVIEKFVEKIKYKISFLFDNYRASINKFIKNYYHLPFEDSDEVRINSLICYHFKINDSYTIVNYKNEIIFVNKEYYTKKESKLKDLKLLLIDLGYIERTNEFENNVILELICKKYSIRQTPNYFVDNKVNRKNVCEFYINNKGIITNYNQMLPKVFNEVKEIAGGELFDNKLNLLTEEFKKYAYLNNGNMMSKKSIVLNDNTKAEVLSMLDSYKIIKCIELSSKYGYESPFELYIALDNVLSKDYIRDIKNYEFYKKRLNPIKISDELKFNQSNLIALKIFDKINEVNCPLYINDVLIDLDILHSDLDYILKYDKDIIDYKDEEIYLKSQLKIEDNEIEKINNIIENYRSYNLKTLYVYSTKNLKYIVDNHISSFERFIFFLNNYIIPKLNENIIFDEINELLKFNKIKEEIEDDDFSI